MHHEERASSETRNTLAETLLNERLGPTGRFPGGKLTDNDGGEIQFAVTVMKGKIVVNFGIPIETLGMSPKQARGFAQSVLRCANNIDKPLQKKNRKGEHGKRKAGWR